MHDRINKLQQTLFEQHEKNITTQITSSRKNIQQKKSEDGVSAPQVQELTSASVYMHPRANRYIDLDGGYIGYELNFRKRRSLGIYVSAQGVSVNVPKRALQMEIEKFLKEKSRWIFRKLKEHQDRQYKQEASRIHWSNGAQLAYLGKPMTLVLLEERYDIQLKENQNKGFELCIGCSRHKEIPPVFLRHVVQKWMQQQAQTFFEARCAYYAPVLGVQPVQIKLTNAATRWGSANSDGVIRLHWRLMEMPLELLDYVVVHELAHLHEMNHSDKYWLLVESILPDYKTRRLQLKNKNLPIW